MSSEDQEFITSETVAGLCAILHRSADQFLHYKYGDFQNWRCPTAPIGHDEIIGRIRHQGTIFGIKNPDYKPEKKPIAGQVWIVRDDADRMQRNVIIYRVESETVDVLYKHSASRHEENLSTWRDLPIENLIKFTGVRISLVSYVARLDGDA